MGIEGALLATTILGVGISAYGSYREGQDAAEASEYNARIAREEAALVEQAGALEVSRQRTQVERLIGSQRAITAGSGIELTGSALDIMINTAAEGELDAQILEYNTKIQASRFRSQSARDLELAGASRVSGVLKAGSTILTQGSKIGTDYFGFGYREPTATKID